MIQSEKAAATFSVDWFCETKLVGRGRKLAVTMKDSVLITNSLSA